MIYTFLGVFLILSGTEAIYLWIYWSKIKSLIGAMKTLNKMIDITKMIGMNHPAVNDKKFMAKVATFMGNYIETTWLWVTILLIINILISLILATIISLLILVIK
jgi:hypothetical protein